MHWREIIIPHKWDKYWFAFAVMLLGLTVLLWLVSTRPIEPHALPAGSVCYQLDARTGVAHVIPCPCLKPTPAPDGGVEYAPCPGKGVEDDDE